MGIGVTETFSNSTRTVISELMEGGKSLKKEEEIMEYVERYYQDLYINDDEEGRKYCMSSVPRVVTDKINAQLTAPFDIFEVEKAMKEVPKHKAVGHDSISA